MTFDDVKRILEDPRTLALGENHFQIEGEVYEIDPLDLMVYRDQAMRDISEWLGCHEHASLWRRLFGASWKVLSS